MAAGDVVSGLSSVAASGNLDYQPAAGVEVLIRSVFYDSVTSCNFGLYNGTLLSRKMGNSTILEELGSLGILLNNTNYLRIQNGSAGALTLGYTGIQTK